MSRTIELPRNLLPMQQALSDVFGETFGPAKMVSAAEGDSSFTSREIHGLIV